MYAGTIVAWPFWQNVADPSPQPLKQIKRSRDGFRRDFRRFFRRGLSALLPTLITLWLVVWAWNFLWQSVGIHVIYAIQQLWIATNHPIPPRGLENTPMAWAWPQGSGEFAFGTKLIGVLVAVVLVYLLGVLIGNFIGRTTYRVLERAVLRVPFVRAIYPAIKQITDFLLADRTSQFDSSRVVAVRPHEDGIWSIALITGGGIQSLSSAVGQEMVTVFVPSSPTAFSGYVMIVPRANVVDLPLTVEEALRLLVSGGVVAPVLSAASPAPRTAPAVAQAEPITRADGPEEIP
jgi:uncharacterized membrane protein